MNYAEWESSVSEDIRNDALWSVEVYRLSLFAATIGWQDVSKLFNDSRTRSLADQLNRALGSISANIAEGYSRSMEKDRARFFEYALGSARESRDWYYKAQPILTDAVVEHRITLLTQIVRLLLTTLNNLRTRTIREEPEEYQV